MINYPLKDFQIFHYDLYRIKNINEIHELDIYENVRNNITLIEWPEIIFKNSTIIDEYNYYKKDLIKIDTNLKIITKKPLTASNEELIKNKRARSAKLRVAEL